MSLVDGVDPQAYIRNNINNWFENYYKSCFISKNAKFAKCIKNNQIFSFIHLDFYSCFYFYYLFSLLAYYLFFAKVCATINGKMKDASPYIFENFAFSLIFPQVKASDILAPESLPS